MLELCTRLSSSAWTPLVPSSLLCARFSFSGVEQAHMALASQHTQHCSQKGHVPSRSSAVKETMHTLTPSLDIQQQHNDQCVLTRVHGVSTLRHSGTVEHNHEYLCCVKTLIVNTSHFLEYLITTMHPTRAIQYSHKLVLGLLHNANRHFRVMHVYMLGSYMSKSMNNISRECRSLRESKQCRVALLCYTHMKPHN